MTTSDNEEYDASLLKPEAVEALLTALDEGEMDDRAVLMRLPSFENYALSWGAEMKK